jgi:hypothetical protein
MRAAALLLVSSVIWYCFSPSGISNTYAITASSPEYRLYSALAPSVIEEVFSFSFQYCRGCFLSATPNPINPFRAKLLTIACIVPPGAVYESAIASTSVCMYISQGANINRWMVSNVSILMLFSASTTWYSGEWWNLLNFLIRAVFLRRGLVSGRVWRSVYSFTARL